MCIVFLAIGQDAQYPLVLAANRDEFYDRPTAPAGFWADSPQLLAGRDLQGGGTWLGVTCNGRLAVLTNFREPGREDLSGPSRGRLVTDFLLSSQGIEEFLACLQQKAASYNGFNLIFGFLDRLVCFSNRARTPVVLSAGIYGLSNALLDDPWPKVKQGKAALSRALENGFTGDWTGLLGILQDRTRPALSDLPHTGLDPSLEYDLSSVFVQRPEYGTRASTVLLVDRNKKVMFWEKTQPGGEVRHYSFLVRG